MSQHQDLNLTQQVEPSYGHVIEDKISKRSQWPLVLIVLGVWCALWQKFDLFTILGGLLLTLFAMWVFHMPPIPFPGRMNLWYTLKFSGIFLWKVTVASLHIARQAIFRSSNITNGVVAVKLRSHDDFIVTLVGHAYALIPGSLVVDVDRATSTLYLHVMNVYSDQDAKDFVTDSLAIEAHIIRAIGSKEDYALVKAEDEAKDGVIRRQTDEHGEEYSR